MTEDQYKSILNEITSIAKGLQSLSEEIAAIKNAIPENFVDLRISTDGAIEEVQSVCETVDYLDL